MPYSIDLGPDAGPDQQDMAPTPRPDTVDLEIELGQPVFNIATGSTVCEAGSAAYLHIPIIAIKWSLDESTYGPTGSPPQIAITRADPQAGDWETGDWLMRTAPINPGLYARLALSETPAVGRYRAYVNVAGYILRAPGEVTFE